MALTEEGDGMNSTVFMVFVLPFLVGAMLRLAFIKWKRGYMISGAFALLSVIAWFWTTHLVNHGVDGTILLWALMATELTAASLIVGEISLLMKKIK